MGKIKKLIKGIEEKKDVGLKLSTDNYHMLAGQDDQLLEYMLEEHQRQNDHLELIASENYVSEGVMNTLGSVLTNKYAEGYPGKRYYGGCEYVDKVEVLAQERLLKLFGGDHANVQPHCGTSANIAVYNAVLKPGDTVLAMDLNHGGHLSHGSPVSISGQLYNFVHYGINPQTMQLDYNIVREMAILHQPKLIVAGCSNYSRIIDFEIFADIAKEVGAYLLVDMAHIAGLIAAGLHPNPVPYADFVTSTTHKTLRGPRSGVIICKKEYQQIIDKSIFPSTQGGPLMHTIASKAFAFGEALKPEFKTYQQQIIKNAQALSTELINLGYKIVSGGTDNHLFTIDLTDTGVTGKQLEANLDKCLITVNKNTIPFDKLSPQITSGIRIGTPALTTRGFKEDDMREIAMLINMVIVDFEVNQQQVIKAVNKLTAKYPL